MRVLDLLESPCFDVSLESWAKHGLGRETLLAGRGAAHQMDCKPIEAVVEVKPQGLTILFGINHPLNFFDIKRSAFGDD